MSLSSDTPFFCIVNPSSVLSFQIWIRFLTVLNTSFPFKSFYSVFLGLVLIIM